MLCNIDVFVSDSGSRKLVAWTCKGIFFSKFVFVLAFSSRGLSFWWLPFVLVFFIEIKLFYSLKKEKKKEKRRVISLEWDRDYGWEATDSLSVDHIVESLETT